ncbi:MAG: UDP-glucose 4-epimerase GalE, partial [Christensenellales bacterium]
EKALDEVFAKHDIDAIIHFAGYKAVGESTQKPLEYYDNNLNSTLVLCRLMKKHNVKRIIFSSSATVYGSPKTVPITEDFPRWCTNPYGWTKFMNEQILRDVAAANPDWSVVLLRYFNPVGAHISGRIGEDPQGIPNNLTPYITQVAIGRRDKVHVFGNDYPTKDGTGVRDYIHVVDLATGHVAAIKYAAAHSGSIAINLGTGVGYSVLDMISAFSRAVGKEIPYTIDARRPGDIAECYADPKLAYDLLGWKAVHTLDDMCADSWRWQQQNPYGYSDKEA